MHPALDPTRLERFVTEHPLALIEVWADWSGSAYLVAAVLDRVLGQPAHGAVARGRVDVSAHPEILDRFGLEGAPAVLLYRDGRLVDRLVGLVSPDLLGARLRAVETPNSPEDSP